MTPWEIRTIEFANCNCAYGCPCQFNALPTYGTCEAVVCNEITEGHYGDIKLDGLKFGGVFAWPGPIHEGKGKAQPFVDERATPAQRDAILKIMSGQDTAPMATVFAIFASTLTGPTDAARWSRVPGPRMVPASRTSSGSIAGWPQPGTSVSSRSRSRPWTDGRSKSMRVSSGRSAPGTRGVPTSAALRRGRGSGRDSPPWRRSTRFWRAIWSEDRAPDSRLGSGSGCDVGGWRTGVGCG